MKGNTNETKMAFSFRKMFSNISYFKRPEEDLQCHIIENGSMKRRHDSSSDQDKSQNLSYEKADLDLSNRRFAKTTKKLPDAVKHFTATRCSLSDTDLSDITKKDRNSKKLKLDVEKANKSASETLDVTFDNKYADDVIENTPKQISLGYSGNIFSEKFKEIDFNKSFDLFDYMSDGRPSSSDKDLEVPWAEHSESELSASEDDIEVKMCKKVNDLEYESSVESFIDLELDRTEDQRITLLLSYRMKLEKMEIMLKNLLTEFQFQIEVSKIFQSKSQVTTLPGADVSKIPKVLGDIAYCDSLSRNDSPTGSWNIVMRREDNLTKLKLRKQLLSMQKCIHEFMEHYLGGNHNKKLNFKKEHSRKLRINRKKRDKRIEEFPDLNDVLHNLFNVDGEITKIVDLEDGNDHCDCCCHKDNDSGLTTKSSLAENQTITSSIGNFSLDISSLSAFSESLDNISYSSFSDDSFFSCLLQKSAMERIMFYVQVHSIEIRNEPKDAECSTKSVINFYCQACRYSVTDERGLLKHILCEKHVERLHFLYKTKYIWECIRNNVEIQPSTILNPMTMYRDLNKIVCFGNSKYACSLCFENNIVGESVLIAHCADSEHVERKNRLPKIFE